MERGEARSVRAEVLNHACARESVGDARSDQAAEDAAPSRADILTVAQRLFLPPRVLRCRCLDHAPGHNPLAPLC